MTKLTIPRAELKEALAGLSRVIPRKATLPILETVRFSAGDGAEALATNLDEHLSYRFQNAEIVEAGAPVHIEARHLQPLAKGASADPVTIEALAGGKACITHPVAGQSISSTVLTLDPQDWPGSAPSVPTAPVDPAFLHHLRLAMPFASGNDSKPVLTGVYLDVSNPSHHAIVANDGRRLTALNSMSLPFGESLIVPASKFLGWARVEGQPRIGASRAEDHTWFGLSCGPWRYEVRAIDGVYPSWRQVVPGPFEGSRFEFTDEACGFVRQVISALPEEREPGICLCAAGAGFDLRAFNAETQEWVSFTVAGSRHCGDVRAITVNRRFLLEALDARFRVFEVQDACSPLVARSEGGALHVLMPMRGSQLPPEAIGESVRADEPAQETAGACALTVPEAPEQPTRKEISAMTDTSTAREETALDRIVAAYETAKTAVREANNALALVAGAVREAIREEKARRREIDEVRAGLLKLQSIKV